MKKFVMVVLLAGVVAAATVRPIGAQNADARTIKLADSSMIQVIRLKNGSSIVGRIVEIRTDSIRVQSDVGQIVISQGSVRDVTTSPVSALHDGEYWYPNPNRSRLFFAPTGEMLKQGEGYISDFELVFVGGAVGVTDHITLGGGTILPAPGTVYFVTPKIGFSPRANLHLATGAMIIGFTDEGVSDIFGVYYGAATMGNSDKSITTGIGYGFAGKDISSKPLMMLGGESRVSRRIALLTENYIVAGESPLLSFGFRFLGEKMSADLGAMILPHSSSSVLPLVNFIFKF